MDPLFWLYQDNFRTYNIEVAKKLQSVKAAIYLSELAQRYKYHSDRNELIQDEKYGSGWFYFTSDKCYERTALTEKEQRTAQKILENEGLIESVSFGLPNKKHFKIKSGNVLEYFGFSNNNSSSAKRANCFGQKGEQDKTKRRTALYIEEPKEEPKEEQQRQRKEAVVVPSDFNLKFLSLQGILDAAAEECNEKWRISYKTLMALAKKYGICYLTDQVEYMFSIQLKAIHDESSIKSRKVQRIENPEVYLKLACEKNYALSDQKGEKYD